MLSVKIMIASLSVQDMTEVIARQFISLRRNFPFAMNVIVLSGGASLGHLFTLAAAPILTRLYLPNDLGDLGLFNAFVAVAVVIASLQYDVAIVTASNQREAVHLAILAMLVVVPMSAMAGLVLYVLIHYSLVGFGALPAHSALLMVVAILFTGLFSILRYWALRDERFDHVSRALVFQNAGRSISQLALGVTGSHSLGLLLGEVIGRGIGMGRLLRNTWSVVREYDLNFSDVSKTLLANRQFPLYSTPSSLLNVLGTSLPLPLLMTLYGADAGGYYSLVWRVLAVPVALIGASMADAFHSRAAIFSREDPGRLLWFFHSTSLGLLAMGLVPALLVLFYGKPIFLFVFGSKWEISGAIAAIVAPWFLTSFIVSPLSRLVYVLHGQRLKLIYDILILGGNLLVFWLARHLDWPMLYMITVMSAMNTVSKVVYYFVLLRLAQPQRQGVG